MSFRKDFDPSTLLTNPRPAKDIVRDFPDLLPKFLATPNPFTSTIKSEALLGLYGAACLLDRTSRMTAKLADILAENLDPGISAESPYSPAIASIFGEILLHQTGLPLRRRMLNLITKGEKITAQKMNEIEMQNNEFGVMFDHTDDTSSTDRLVKSIALFRDTLTPIASEAELKIDPADVLLPKIEYLSPAVDSFAEGYDLIQQGASSGFRSWSASMTSDVVSAIVQNPEAFNLLIAGRLNNFSKFIRGPIWVNTVFYSGEAKPVSEDPALPQALELMLSDTDIQIHHWTLFATEPAIAKPTDKFGTNYNWQTERHISGSRFIEWAVLQDPKVFEQFMETFTAENIKASSKEVMNGLMLTAAYLKGKYPDNQNAKKFVEMTLEEAGEESPRTIRPQTINILKGALTGLIYQNSNFEPIPKLPNASQTREEAVAEISGNGSTLLFASKSGWQEPVLEKPEPEFVIPEEPKLVVTTSEYTLPGIGKISETDPDSAKLVLKALNKKVDYPAAYFAELEEMAAKPKILHQATHILFPGLLPKGHPLGSLETAGIVAVAQQGTEVNLIVNPEKAGIDLEPQGGNLALRGEVVKRMLVMDGAINGFAHFRIHQLAEAALSYLGNPNLSKELSRDEIGEARRIIKDWKTTARNNGLPQNLSRVDDPIYRDPNSIYTFAQIGNKNDLLRIQ